MYAYIYEIAHFNNIKYFYVFIFFSKKNKTNSRSLNLICISVSSKKNVLVSLIIIQNRVF